MEESVKSTKMDMDIAGGKLFNFRPAFFIAVFLGTGIAFAYCNRLYDVSAWWSFLLLLIVCIPFLFCRSLVRAKRILLAIIVLTIFFCVGFFSFQVKANDFFNAGVYSGDCKVVGRVIGKEKTENGWRLTLDGVYIDGTKENGKLVAYFSNGDGQGIALSDELVVSGFIRTQTEWSHTDTSYYLWADDYAVTGNEFNLFLSVRGRIQTVLYAGMDETPAAVTMAVLTGDTSGMESGLLNNIRAGGVAHIFAVSGLHIGALFGACIWLIGKTKLRRTPKIFRFIFVCAVLLFYGGVCGYSPSVVRAIIVCLVVYASKLIGIGWDMLENIGVAAVLVLLLSPTALFEVGFQLSFSACLGIALLAKPMQRTVYAFVGKISKGKLLVSKDAPPTITQSAVRASISFLVVTISAQIFTTPILWNAFGYLSVWSLLLNCVFVPLIGVLFSLLLFLALVASVLPVALASYLLFVPNVLLSAGLLFFEFFDFSSTVLSGMRLRWNSFVCYYLACTFATDKWNITRVLRAFLFSVCTIAFAISCFL